MLKIIIKIFLVFTLFCFLSCESDTATEPKAEEGNDQALIGKWLLTTTKKNGNTVSYESLPNCFYELQYNANGTGLVWKRDYGAVCGCNEFAWSTNGDRLTIHELNEYPFIVTYSVSNGQCSITYIDDGQIELIYSKEE